MCCSLVRIYGVVIGILLSFVAVILMATTLRDLSWMIPGKEVYYDLERNVLHIQSSM